MGGKSLWSGFWARVWAVDIRTKIMGIVVVCVLCSALALVWYTYHDVSAALKAELQERGIAIGSSLAAQSQNPILTGDRFALYALAKDARDSAKDLEYVFVLDPDGNVMVHTFDDGFPVDLLGVNEVPPGATHRVQDLRTEEDRIQDVAVPVLGGRAGVVRLGMSEATISAAVVGHIRHISLWFALILVLGLLVAYGLASILTKPLSRLAEAARAVGRGDFQWKAPVWARDEIGTLGAAFDEMSAELKRKEEIRTQLLAKVIGAQEDERKRISRELHDETGQALTSLMLGLKSLEQTAHSNAISEKTAELRALAAQTLEEVHHLAMELRPSLLDDLGLSAAVQRYTKEYSSKTNINVDAHIDGLSEQRLPSEYEIAVYRIIQEALTNVAKHAEAKNASVVLMCRDSMLVTIVEDDGRGFDVEKVMTSADGKRLGLFGMYERVSLIDGHLAIESEPGNGTSIFVEVPLKPIREAVDGQDQSASR